MSKLRLFLTVVTLILTLPIVTSCLEDDDSVEIITDAHFAEVRSEGYNMYYFVDAAGMKLNPSPESAREMERKSVNFSPGISYIRYTKPIGGYPGETTETGYQIELQAGAPIDREFIYSDASGQDDFISTASIIGLDEIYSNNSRMLIMNKRYLLLNINYYIGAASDGKAKPHRFAVVYNSDETVSGSTALKLYLRHDSMGDTSTDYLTANVADFTLYCMAFDMKSAFEHFESITGKKGGFKITLTADIEKSGESSKIENAVSEEYTITYIPGNL